MDITSSETRNDFTAPASTANTSSSHEEAEEYYRRRRAKSEVTSDMSKGRLIAAWASFKRSWELRRLNEEQCCLEATAKSTNERNENFLSGSSSTDPHIMSLATNAAVAEAVAGSAQEARHTSKPRKVISLLLCRRRTAHISDVGLNLGAHEATEENNASREPDPGDSSDSLAQCGKRDSVNAAKRARFRRVRSQMSPPVTNAAAYAAYAAELDDNSFIRLREFTKEIATHRRLSTATTTLGGAEGNSEDPDGLIAPIVAGFSSDEDNDAIIGEIQLEDFADGSSDDFDFMDNPTADDAFVSRRQSTKLESQRLTWIGNESEIQAFFADFGLDDILIDVETPERDITVFDISSETLAEWEGAIRDHNETFQHWENVFSQPPDIRTLSEDFNNRRLDAMSRTA